MAGHDNNGVAIFLLNQQLILDQLDYFDENVLLFHKIYLKFMSFLL